MESLNGDNLKFINGWAFFLLIRIVSLPPKTFPLRLGKGDTDGCWNLTNSKASFGSIFTNERGDWELGYFGRMMARSSLETEIWSIYRGLMILLENGMANVHIESDSQMTVILFNEGASTAHPQSSIINDGKYLLSYTGSTLSHIYRGANECADFLARFGTEQSEDLVVANTPPVDIREFMNRDRLNLRLILD